MLGRAVCLALDGDRDGKLATFTGVKLGSVSHRFCSLPSIVIDGLGHVHTAPRRGFLPRDVMRARRPRSARPGAFHTGGGFARDVKRSRSSRKATSSSQSVTECTVGEQEKA